jgi:hypothetical protein
MRFLRLYTGDAHVGSSDGIHALPAQVLVTQILPAGQLASVVQPPFELIALLQNPRVLEPARWKQVHTDERPQLPALPPQTKTVKRGERVSAGHLRRREEGGDGEWWPAVQEPNPARLGEGDGLKNLRLVQLLV